MKKFVILFAVTVFACVNVFAQALPEKGIIMRVGSGVAVIDGERQTLDAAPEIIGERTFVPIRFCSQAMGAEVDYIDETNTVVIRKGSKTVELIIGSVAYKVNGDILESDVAPVIKNGRTLVPVRQVAEALDTQVQWYDEYNIVTVGFESAETAVEEYLNGLFNE